MISVICYVLLIAQAYSEPNCKNNVTPEFRENLITTLNKKCSSLNVLNPAKFNNGIYDCQLGQKAFRGELSGPSGLYSFDGNRLTVLFSNFDGDWEKSLTEAVNDADKIDPSTYLNRVTVMCGLPVSRIGCSIEPTEPTFAEMFHLRCNYE